MAWLCPSKLTSLRQKLDFRTYLSDRVEFCYLHSMFTRMISAWISSYFIDFKFLQASKLELRIKARTPKNRSNQSYNLIANSDRHDFTEKDQLMEVGGLWSSEHHDTCFLPCWVFILSCLNAHRSLSSQILSLDGFQSLSSRVSGQTLNFSCLHTKQYWYKISSQLIN